MERAFDDVTVMSEDGKRATLRCHLEEMSSGDRSEVKVSGSQLKITVTVDGKLYAKTIDGVNGNTVAKAKSNKKYVEVKVDKGTPAFTLAEKI